MNPFITAYSILALILMIVDSISGNHVGASCAACTIFILGGINSIWIKLDSLQTTIRNK